MALACPISRDTVDVAGVRGVATLVATLAVAHLATGHAFVAGVLVADFAARSFGARRLSPLRFVSLKALGLLKVRSVRVPAAPKVFAARLGFAMASLLLLASLAHWTLVGYVVDVLFLVFAGLESLFSVCVGCHIYTLVSRAVSRA